MNRPSTEKPNAASVGRWIRSWIQPNDAIHGFHNHSVWGDNPFRYGDFTAGHSTFASPFAMGLARALTHIDDPRGQALLDQVLRSIAVAPSIFYEEI